MLCWDGCEIGYKYCACFLLCWSSVSVFVHECGIDRCKLIKGGWSVYMSIWILSKLWREGNTKQKIILNEICVTMCIHERLKALIFFFFFYIWNMYIWWKCAWFDKKKNVRNSVCLWHKKMYKWNRKGLVVEICVCL